MLTETIKAPMMVASNKELKVLCVFIVGTSKN